MSAWHYIRCKSFKNRLIPANSGSKELSGKVHFQFLSMGWEGLEPPLLAEPEPKSGASAISPLALIVETDWAILWSLQPEGKEGLALQFLEDFFKGKTQSALC